jgi:hypothetical protein
MPRLARREKGTDALPKTWTTKATSCAKAEVSFRDQEMQSLPAPRKQKNAGPIRGPALFSHCFSFFSSGRSSFFNFTFFSTKDWYSF